MLILNTAQSIALVVGFAFGCAVFIYAGVLLVKDCVFGINKMEE